MANEIQELKFQVGEAWKGVYSSSTAYGLANVVQDPTGLSIYRSLKSGNVGHPVTDSAWWFCIIDMSSIKAESDRIEALNQAIAQDEVLRVAAEELRQQHEAARIAAETQRDEAEQARISAEQARVNAESARATAEQQRITAEQGRVSAESARVQAEQARVLSETLRANAEDQRAANEQNRIAAEQQRIERAEQDHDRAESDHAALQVYFDSLGAFDISSYHATDGVLAKYADLTAALGTNGANIPEAIRKGGMSVKFVLSSDNKYVQYRLMSNDWSTNTDEWAVAEEGVYAENPEFIYVKTDAEDKILWAIKADGSIYYGAGVPSQIQEELENKADLADLAELAEVAANKVDKEEGKSLIDAEYASTKSTTDDSEFLEVKTDKDGKILEDITIEGRKEIHIPVDTPSCSVDSIDNPDWMSVETDAEGKILSGRKKDGTKVENNPVIFNDNISLSDEGLAKLKEDLGTQDGNILEYPCVRDAAKDGYTGVIKVGSELYASVVNNPSELTHKQDAYANPYYDANSTLKQYATIGSRTAIPENICNRADQEEIDFTPSVTGKTRVIVGKSSHDVFFVARINCNYGDGVPDTASKENCLETTTDFITFTPIFKCYDSETITDGLSINNCTRLEIMSVKEFANGNFIVAGKAKYNDVLKTFFFLLSKDFSSISLMSCTYLDGTVDIMADEFHNDLYDWHINIVGSKALVSTYGSRQPETDYGRVWYTEDNGVTWKQIFQMTNHYQDGVSPEDPPVTRVHTHGVMIDAYDGKLYVIAGEDNANLFWSDKGWNTTDNDWNVISIRRDLPLQHQVYMQVVNGYAFATNLVFGSDCSGAGAIYRLNKLNKDSYSRVQVAHEFLPNKYPSTMYCAAGMYRRDNHTPLFMCETHENAQLTEEDNEGLNYYHRARVVATYDGINFTEIWTDDTYGEHETYIEGEGKTTRKFCWCTREMNFYLLNNGDAVVKYSGRPYYYYGGNPMYSVKGNAKGCCKVRIIKNVERFL